MIGRKAAARAAVFLVLLATGRTAQAWSVVHPEDEPDVLVRWPGDGPIPWVFEHHGPPGLGFGASHAAVAASFEAWSSLVTADIAFDERSDYTEREVVVDGVNTLWWTSEEWDEDPAVLAVTAVSFYSDGEIVDADIEFNADRFTWSVGGEGTIDLQSVTTHEIGHLLGLDHSDVDGATMAATYLPGDASPRSLEVDDEAGAAYLYPCPGDGCGPEGEGACAFGGPARTGLVALFALALGLWARPAPSRRRQGIGRAAVLALLAAQAGSDAGVAEASTAPRTTLDAALIAADVVVRARVEATTPTLDDRGRVRTTTRLAVRRASGEPVPARFDLDRLGGASGPLTTRVLGAPRFRVGDELVLALVRAPSGRWAPVGLWQGRLVVGPDGRASRPEDGPHAARWDPDALLDRAAAVRRR